MTYTRYRSPNNQEGESRLEVKESTGQLDRSMETSMRISQW